MPRFHAAGRLACVALLLAACGGDGEATQEPTSRCGTQVTGATPGTDTQAAALLEEARRALVDTPSYRVSGRAVNGGEPVGIDLLFVRGEGAQGSLTWADSTVEIVSTAGFVYVKGDEAFLMEQAGEDAAELFRDKWISFPLTDDSEFSSFVDGATFAADVLANEGSLSLTDVREVEGEPAVGLVSGDCNGTLWVAAEGEHRPILWAGQAGEPATTPGGTPGRGAGTGSPGATPGAPGDAADVLRFAGYGEDDTITAPPPADVMDGASLGE